ncbi:HEAT repeat domain-containing protein [Cellulomonas sp. URHB0016]
MDDERYLTPRRGASWDEIGAAVESLGGAVADPVDEDTLFEWALPGATVRLFDDVALRVEQLAVSGVRRDEVADELARRVPCYAPVDVPALVAGAAGTPELRHALGVLGAVAPPTADPELLGVLRRALTHPDPEVRAAAALAASVPRWPELRADVERLTRDDDEDVSDLAVAVLGTFEPPAPA